MAVWISLLGINPCQDSMTHECGSEQCGSSNEASDAPLENEEDICSPLCICHCFVHQEQIEWAKKMEYHAVQAWNMLNAKDLTSVERNGIFQPPRA